MSQNVQWLHFKSHCKSQRVNRTYTKSGLSETWDSQVIKRVTVHVVACRAQFRQFSLLGAAHKLCPSVIQGFVCWQCLRAFLRLADASICRYGAKTRHKHTTRPAARTEQRRQRFCSVCGAERRTAACLPTNRRTHSSLCWGWAKLAPRLLRQRNSPVCLYSKFHQICPGLLLHCACATLTGVLRLHILLNRVNSHTLLIITIFFLEYSFWNCVENC